MKQKNEILDLSFQFAIEIVHLSKFLNAKNEYILSKQILRSGTSIGANVTEAQAAQSSKDFISKLSIAAKEARETGYWLNLLNETGYLENYSNKSRLFEQNLSIIKLLTKIIITSQNNSKTKKTKSKIRLNE